MISAFAWTEHVGRQPSRQLRFNLPAFAVDAIHASCQRIDRQELRQRHTYLPFTRTRTQAVPAAAAPTAAPPTTARRVVRRATPATLAGVAGRPTLASALWTASAGPSLDEKSIEPNIPKPRVATNSSARFTLEDFISTSIGGLKQWGQFLEAVDPWLDLDQSKRGSVKPQQRGTNCIVQSPDQQGTWCAALANGSNGTPSLD